EPLEVHDRPLVEPGEEPGELGKAGHRPRFWQRRRRPPLTGRHYRPARPRHGPARQNFNPGESSLGLANISQLTQQWSAPLDAGLGGQPLVTASAVYTSGVVGSTFVVSAADRGTGAPLWRREFPVVDPAHIERLLSVANGKVLLLR